MSMEWRKFKRELMNDPLFAAEYEALGPEYELAKSIITLRLSKGLTPKGLAEKMQTTQSGISRLESGNSKLEVATLDRLTKVLDTRVVAHLE